MDDLDVKKVILSKLEYLQKYLGELDFLLQKNTEDILKDSTVLRAIERLLQLIIDTAIDINTAIIQKEDLQPSDYYQGTFLLIAQCGALPHELARDIAPSVGLRNALVHQYEKIEPERVIGDAKKDIEQYRAYIKYIFEYAEKTDY